MKNLFVILAIAAMAGCSNMPWEKSSSGSMSSSGMESGSTSATSQRGAYSEDTKGLYNPYNPSANPEAPMPITP